MATRITINLDEHNAQDIATILGIIRKVYVSESTPPHGRQSPEEAAVLANEIQANPESGTAARPAVYEPLTDEYMKGWRACSEFIEGQFYRMTDRAYSAYSGETLTVNLDKLATDLRDPRAPYSAYPARMFGAIRRTLLDYERARVSYETALAVMMGFCPLFAELATYLSAQVPDDSVPRDDMAPAVAELDRLYCGLSEFCAVLNQSRVGVNGAPVKPEQWQTDTVRDAIRGFYLKPEEAATLKHIGGVLVDLKNWCNRARPVFDPKSPKWVPPLNPADDVPNPLMDSDGEADFAAVFEALWRVRDALADGFRAVDAATKKLAV